VLDKNNAQHIDVE